MTYRELACDPRLRAHVACYWIRELGPGDEDTHPVLPDGCIDFLFESATGTLEVVGTMTRAAWISARGPARWVGVRFKPGGAVPFLRDRADLVTDRSVELPARELQAKLQNESTARAQIEALERYLLSELARTRPIDRRIPLAARRLMRDPAEKIDVLARDLALSRQFLRRLFLEHTGVTPRTFARLARLIRAAELVKTRSLADAAAEAGYADQAHLTREFKRITGITPAAWKAR